ncbi:MAG: hypothetical protein ABEJ02_02895 [Candidatus Paceibacteria bacterium]
MKNDSLADIGENFAKMGSYIGIKMENGNTAWVDPNGRVLETNEEKEILDTEKAEVQEENSKSKNLANQAFDEAMGKKFAEAFD